MGSMDRRFFRCLLFFFLLAGLSSGISPRACPSVGSPPQPEQTVTPERAVDAAEPQVDSPEDLRRAFSTARSATTLKAAVAELDRIRAAAPGSYRAGLATLLHGCLLFEAGDHAGAVRELTKEEVKKTDLGNYAKFYASVSLHKMNSQGRRAAEILAGLVEEEGKSALGLRAAALLGEVYLSGLDRARGEKLLCDLAESTQSEEARVRYYYSIAKACQEAGWHRKARAYYGKIYFQYPLVSAGSDAGNLRDAAERYLRPHLKSFPRERHLARADLLWEKKSYARALEAYEWILRNYRSGSDLRRIHLRMGICYQQKGNGRAALRVLTPIAEGTAPVSPELTYTLARAHLLTGKDDRYLSMMKGLAESSSEPVWAPEAIASLARYYEYKGLQPEARTCYEKLLARFPGFGDAPKTSWKIAWYAYQANPDREAFDRFLKLAAGFQDSAWAPAGAYWAGRCAEGMGRPQDAVEQYRKAVEWDRYGFYGILGQGRLQAIAHSHPEVSPAAETLSKDDFVKRDPPAGERGRDVPPGWAKEWRRVEELEAIGLVDMALDELKVLEGRYPKNQQKVFLERADIYYQKGEYLSAFSSIFKGYPGYAAEGMPEAYWKKLYPLVYWDTITSVARKRGVDPYLVAAIIRQESAFGPSARSRAGARGVMQLMPATARRAARNLRLGKYSTARLYEPKVNIEIGVYHFAKLLTSFSNRVVYALAGYNAGEARVRDWIQGGGAGDIEAFIEAIPFDETRVYVKNILRDYYRYRRLYGNGGRPELPL
jgi:soluble lytic murein transglycosylase